MNVNLQKLFEEIKKNEIEKIQNRKERSKTLQNDPRFIEFKPLIVDGKKKTAIYKLRLLFTVSEKRKHPFIIKNTHACVTNGNYSWITCPTSDYLLGETFEGFKACLVCQEARKLFAEGKDENKLSSAELYKKIKRQFHMFVPVYVVSDPNNPANDGQIKIARFGVKIYNFLMRSIFGIDPKTKEKFFGEDVIGADAFDLQNGFDFVISVSQNDQFNEYSVQFARKSTTINITNEQIEKAIKELKFDEDFFTPMATKEEQLKFIQDHILNAYEDDEEVIIKEEKNKIEENKVNKVKVEEIKVENKIENKESKVENNKVNNNEKSELDNILIEDSSIEDLLKDIEADYNEN